MRVRAALVLALAAQLAMPGTPAVAAPAAAAATPVTERDAITVGYQDAAFPFSYLGPDGKHTGYSVELCQHVVGEIERRRGGRRLDVRPFSVTSRTRIPHLLAGTIDLECGSTSNTAGRAGLGVAFSLVSFVSDVAVLARSGTRELRKVEDLGLLGRDDPPIVTTAGSTAGRHLRDFEQAHDLSLKVETAADHDASFRMLQERRASAFVMDRVLLKARLAWESQCAAGAAQELRFLDGEVSPDAVEHYGLMMRSRDEDLKRVVDASLLALMKSGRIAAIYERWFLQPIPGMAGLRHCAGGEAGTNVGLEMSPALRRLFEQPSDAPFDPAARAQR